MTEPEPVRLVVLGDASAAPVCEGDACYLPPPAADAPPPEPEPAGSDRPQ